MKKDIESKDDIRLLINRFYEKVRIDETIGYFFSEVIPVNFEKHLPVMYEFWENILFHTGSYAGNPMKTHQQLHQLSPLNTVHFNKWLAIFKETVDELYSGNNAELIKQRAMSIATTMQLKILHQSPFY